MLLFWGKRKNTSRTIRTKATKKLFLGFLFLLLLLFVINGIAHQSNIYEFFFGPVNPKAEKVKWDGQTVINVAVFGDPVLIFNFNPNEKIINLLSIPASTYTYINDNYGWYRLSSSYGLGQLEDNATAGRIFLLACQNLLVTPIDYYVKVDNPNLEKFNFDKLKYYQKEFLGAKSFVNFFIAPFRIHRHIDTNLTLFDLYRLWWQAKSTRITEENYVDASNLILEPLILADGSLGYTPKPEELDKFVSRVFNDINILEEGLSISILNSTAREGLGNDIRRLLENLGVNVVNVGNYEPTLDKSTIIISDSSLKNKYTLRRLSKVLKIPIYEAVGKETDFSDITIILGQDLKDRGIF